MLKVLIKKQLTEVFRGYFYDAKKNKSRSKLASIGWFIFFIAIMVGVLGGIFLKLSLSICTPLSAAGMGWLYFLLMSGISIVLGVFGSVFNTFSSLYLSKDNDLLLSMPIPVKYIITSRLFNVYILGAMYSVVAILPALFVYWFNTDLSFMSGKDIGALTVVCGIVLVIIITLFVLVLSCLLGWCVAKISLKLKNKSYITVIVSLVFMGAYYFFYYKAQALISNLIQNAQLYGEKIKGAAYFLYRFGRIGEGDWVSALIFIGVTFVIMLLTWIVLKKTFLSIAISAAKVDRVKAKSKAVKQKNTLNALVSKEFSKFTSSPNYMLNCGLGILFGFAFGIVILFKGNFLINALTSVFEGRYHAVFICLCASLFTISSTNDISAPSVSLEGKNIWIVQSLPVEPKLVLKAKLYVHLILTSVPVLFALICALIVTKPDVLTLLAVSSAVISYLFFSVNFALFSGIKFPNLSWTNEVVPIKQSAAVMLAMFGGWAVCVAFALLYFLVFYTFSPVIFLLVWSLIFAAAAIVFNRYTMTKGADIFSKL